MSFLATQLIGFGVGGDVFSPFATEYTTAITTTVAKPSGATQVIIECIGPGGSGNSGKITGAGGGGGYSKTTVALDGTYTGIYINLVGLAQTRKNDSGGTVLAYAVAGFSGTDGGQGGPAGSGTGDVKHSGGNGVSGGNGGGGGAAGPSGAGSNASGATGGASGGSPAGSGGNSNAVGNAYGGGGGYNGTLHAGGSGYIKLDWS